MGGWVRRAGLASGVAALAAVGGAVAAFVHWSTGSPGAGIVVSVACAVVGFLLGILALLGRDPAPAARRLALAGMIVSALIAAMWFVIVIGALAHAS